MPYLLQSVYLCEVCREVRMIRRVSGILLHVSSLPGAYGIGDLGPEAYRFADFLAEAGQHLWQLLPLGPTDAAFGHSPYHPVSAFAGNPLLISPEGLVSRGWLKKKEIAEHRALVRSEFYGRERLQNPSS